MNHLINTIQYPSELEQVAVATVEGLRRLESLLGYEFAETIYHIQKLHVLKQDPYASMQEYAEASGKGEARRIVEANKYGMPEMEAMNKAVTNLGSDWFSFTSRDEEKAVF